MCGQCKRSKPYRPSPWFDHIYGLYLWQSGGYPFDRDELSADEWIAVGIMKRTLESMKNG